MLGVFQGCSIEQFRIWPFVMKANNTYRPVYFDVEAEMSKQMIEISDNHPWCIFLEIIQLDSGIAALPPFDNDSEVLVFFKLYDPKVRKIYYCGHHYVQSESTISEYRVYFLPRFVFLLDLIV